MKQQQGDVIIRKVTKEYVEKKKLNKYSSEILGHKYNKSITYTTKGLSMGEPRAILQHGEATGHAHAVYLEDMLEEAGIRLYNRSDWRDDIVGFEVIGAPVVLKHEEHDEQILEPGYYEQVIVKEYDHISGITRGVID